MIRKTIAAGALVLGAATFAPAVAQATPGQYTRGADVTVVLAVDNGCATAYYPKGATDTFCGRMTWQQRAITPGDKFGANVMSYTGSSVYCKVIDNATGDVIKADYGYIGSAAICMTNAL